MLPDISQCDPEIIRTAAAFAVVTDVQPVVQRFTMNVVKPAVRVILPDEAYRKRINRFRDFPFRETQFLQIRAIIAPEIRGKFRIFHLPDPGGAAPVAGNLLSG